MLGPSQWANPFLAKGRYRLSAWVRVEDFEHYIDEPGPRVGVEFVQYNGPAMTSTQETTPMYWSPALNGNDTPLPPTMGWTRIEVVTPPCPSNVLLAHLVCEFRGRGTAWFSEVAWELVEPE